MQLWTEYEGRTIAGTYILRKLLRSEGRNAFFATSSEAGGSDVIRLTEAHYDEEAMLKRWRQVAEVHQDNLMTIKRVGEVNLEGITVTYALMEPDDANLEDVLKERPLTPAEATQVAKSTLGALSALHANGLVHEHIEPANVFAVGPVVKLRSDCVRECVADVEFPTADGCEDLRRRDVHDFGLLLLRCLTLEKTWNPALRLPDPFNQVVPHALDGSWGLPQIALAVDASVSFPAPARPAAVVPATGGSAATSAEYLSRPAGSQAANAAATSNGTATARGATAAGPAGAHISPGQAKLFHPRNQVGRTEAARPSPHRAWMLYLAAAIVAVLLGWHFLTGKPVKPSSSAPVQATAGAASQPQAAAPMMEAPPAQPSATTASAGGWYVVAFTYNHEDQARAKAARLGKQHPSLHPQVFSPNGRSFLVSLGGAMTNDEARSVLRRARQSGLPRDTFLRRY